MFEVTGQTELFGNTPARPIAFQEVNNEYVNHVRSNYVLMAPAKKVEEEPQKAPEERPKPKPREQLVKNSVGSKIFDFLAGNKPSGVRRPMAKTNEPKPSDAGPKRKLAF